ncbi:hypothetical protein GCM10027280_45380 [Micromonospora polyrhachis]|uniref:Uncharacterized protein n=1 Tax=Micromonospora polyrhachis TaxID=1282883 RepID=A0A7W7SQ92_9ACTN|nr:hypothetical protein [Micromonospora polyrhachis]MBB4958948.1 hypothetical protein [Micromonospora polyrhachis]
MGEQWEYHEIQSLVGEFDEVLVDAMPEVRKVVQKGALNIKTDARQRISGHPHAPAYPYSITYDTQVTGNSAVAEIGPDKGKRQGALGNILEYGTLKNAPLPHIKPAADEELPRFERALEDLAAKHWEGR